MLHLGQIVYDKHKQQPAVFLGFDMYENWTRLMYEDGSTEDFPMRGNPDKNESPSWMQRVRNFRLNGNPWGGLTVDHPIGRCFGYFGVMDLTFMVKHYPDWCLAMPLGIYEAAEMLSAGEIEVA